MMGKGIEEIRTSLERCPVCKGEAEIVIFGREKHGVWIGCARTDKCSRYIEYHSEGWSIEETARDWNRRNRGILGLIRRLKRWYSENLGAEKRLKKELEAEKMGKRKKKEEKLKEIFGIK